jgi:prepilin-type N-terminal cleavage/methylation domain-containing protein
MTIQTRHTARAFTLVELLIVLAITGILATMVIGTVQNKASQARRVSTMEAARRTHDAIGLFKEQTGRLPDLLSSWAPLTGKTTIDGVTYGPYLVSAPRNLCAAAGGNPSCIADGNLPTLYLNQCTFLYDYNGGSGTGRFIASYSFLPSPTPDSVATASVASSN